MARLTDWIAYAKDLERRVAELEVTVKDLDLWARNECNPWLKQLQKYLDGGGTDEKPPKPPPPSYP